MYHILIGLLAVWMIVSGHFPLSMGMGQFSGLRTRALPRPAGIWVRIAGVFSLVFIWLPESMKTLAVIMAVCGAICIVISYVVGFGNKIM